MNKVVEEEVLMCDDCDTKFDNPIRENKTCGMRLPNGTFCRGRIVKKSIESIVPLQLVCSFCNRTADNMALLGRVCDKRIGNGVYCQGVLENEQ